MITERPDILFIVNPKAGTKAKGGIENIIKQCLNHEKKIKVIFTQYRGHANELSKQAADNGIPLIVAVGGDGTVNEVATGLIHTNSTLAILPMGSGNGLARYFNLPLDLHGALKLLNNYSVKKADAIKLNNNYSFNIAGIGFDAHISHAFDKFGKRGFNSYIKLVYKEFGIYKCPKIKIEINNQVYDGNPFLVSIANGTQFGNSAFIAPEAKIDDGLIDVIILKRPQLWQIPALVFRLFTKRIHKSNLAIYMKTTKLIVYGNTQLHADGEPLLLSDCIKAELIPLALNIAAPATL